MPVPTQDQLMGQLRIVIPALGTIVSAIGVSTTSVDHWTGIALAAVGPIAYVVTIVWSWFANSRASILASAAKPVAPGVAAPQIVLPKEEAETAATLPGNVNTTADVKVVPK